MSERLFVPPGAEDFKRQAASDTPEAQTNNGINIGETMTSSNKAELTATETQAANPEERQKELNEQTNELMTQASELREQKREKSEQADELRKKRRETSREFTSFENYDYENSDYAKLEKKIRELDEQWGDLGMRLKELEEQIDKNLEQIDELKKERIENLTELISDLEEQKDKLEKERKEDEEKMSTRSKLRLAEELSDVVERRTKDLQDA